MAGNDTDCSEFTETTAIEDSCNFAKEPYFIESFAPCIGNTTCNVNFSKGLPGVSFPKPPCLQPSKPNQLCLSAICVGETVEIFGQKINRTKLTFTVVACDMAICVCFVLNGVCIYLFTKKEEKEEDSHSVQVTDFSVRIKNLPSSGDYTSIIELRVLLEQHLKSIVRLEP